MASEQCKYILKPHHAPLEAKERREREKERREREEEVSKTYHVKYKGSKKFPRSSPHRKQAYTSTLR